MHIELNSVLGDSLTSLFRGRIGPLDLRMYNIVLTSCNGTVLLLRDKKRSSAHNIFYRQQTVLYKYCLHLKSSLS